MKLNTLQKFLTGAAACVCAALFCVFAVSSVFVTAHLDTMDGKIEAIEFVFGNVLVNGLFAVAALGALLAVRVLLERFARIHLTAMIALLWALFGIILVIMLGRVQMYDAAHVLEAAQLFAKGNYKMMQGDYLNTYSYQLGMCLPMEMIARILPFADMNVFMQVINVLFSVGSAGFLCAFSQALIGRRACVYACASLLLLALPGMFFCLFVYGVLPMLFFASAALYYFAQYMYTQKKHAELICGACMAAAYVCKPNAAILLIALVICALLYSMKTRKIWPTIFAVLACVVSILLLRAIVFSYEMRSGVSLREDMSMISRLVMGLQRGGGAAGWYNRYSEKFYPLDVTMAQQMEIASADLAVCLAHFKGNPSEILPFFSEKLLSQWIEPTYNVFWQGALCEHHGPMSSFASVLFAQGSTLRGILEGYFAAMQRMLYVLAFIGSVQAVRKHEDVLQMLLPAIFVGSVLYHLIFEAKSQYAYMYVVLMIPLAAQGLCALEDLWRRKIRRS